MNVRQLAVRAIQAIRAWWRPLKAEAQVDPEPEKPKKEKTKKTDLAAVMDKMSAALDSLQEVRKPLNSLAHTSATDYEAILGTVGPLLLLDYGEESLQGEGWHMGEANDFAMSKPPESGAVWLGGENTQDTLYAKCIAFIRVPRMSPGVEICRKHETPYICALLYGDGGEVFGRYWDEFPIAYDATTGTARALKVKRDAQGNVFSGGRGKNSSGGGAYGVGRGAMWSYQRPGEGEPPEKAGCMAFLIAMNAWASRDTGWIVVASKKRRKIVFRVPEADTPRWFKDRITVVTPGGRKRPIIHQVVAHARKTKKGVAYVRPHIRGERKFVWDGAKISVIVPGLHAPTSDAWTKIAAEGQGASSAKHFSRVRDAIDAA